MIEYIGGMTFKDGILVSTFDAEKEIAKRGGIDKMFAESVKGNALLSHLSAKK